MPSVRSLLLGKVMYLKSNLSLVVVALALLCPCAFAQKLADVEPLGVQKKRGWVIPNLRNFRDGVRSPLMVVGPEGKHTLYATEIDLHGGGILLWDAAYYREEHGKRDLIGSPLDARSIYRLDVDGNVFGYIAYGSGAEITKSMPNRSASEFISLGCVMGYAYYDLDGDGRFELLARSNQLGGASIYVPSWVFKEQCVPNNPPARSNIGMHPTPRKRASHRR
jgi:hypothetical protein